MRLHEKLIKSQLLRRRPVFWTPPQDAAYETQQQCLVLAMEAVLSHFE